jgi:transposase
MRWDQIQAVKQRAVERGVARRDTEGIAHLGIDEKSFGKKERFITVLSDLDGERVLEVTPSKSKEAATAAFAAIPVPHRASVEAVAMDMSASYEAVCHELVPQADIVYDKFHVEKMLSESVDTVRRKAHKELLAQGVMVFKRTRYLWLKRPERWTDAQQEQFRDVEREFGAGRLAQSKIGRAWTMKEAFRPFWNFVYRGAAQRYFRRWYYWMTHSKLPPMIRLARTLHDHLGGLLTYFRHGITNAFSEGINSKIQDVKSAARGFRNFENYRIAVLFACGKLDLRP